MDILAKRSGVEQEFNQLSAAVEEKKRTIETIQKNAEAAIRSVDNEIAACLTEMNRKQGAYNMLTDLAKEAGLIDIDSEGKEAIINKVEPKESIEIEEPVELPVEAPEQMQIEEVKPTPTPVNKKHKK
jgi:hypothetical protein